MANDRGARFLEALEWADSRLPEGVSWGKGTPPKDLASFPKKIKPEWGKFSYTLSPSYRAFLERFGWAKATDAEGDSLDEPFWIYSPEEVIEMTSDHVHAPEGVEWCDPAGNDCEITLNHLVAFAEAPGAGGIWCFDTTAPGKDGELPVYYHHEDEPVAARRVANGKPVDPKVKPDARSFVEWFEKRIEKIAGRPKKVPKKPQAKAGPKAGSSKKRSGEARRGSSRRKT
jgi:hypothetical protein